MKRIYYNRTANNSTKAKLHAPSVAFVEKIHCIFLVPWMFLLIPMGTV